MPPARSRAASSSGKAGRAEAEVLKSRLIDRPIRPAVPREGFRNEVQIVATVLSHDLENGTGRDIVALLIRLLRRR